MRGKLFVVPNLLGAVPPAHVLPAQPIAIAQRLRHYIVENAKPARAFLKSLGTQTPIQSISIVELNARAAEDDIDAMLAPAISGDDIGLLSDAGCPGVADPGAKLVGAAHRAGIPVVPLVGPSSVLLALMASGLNGQGFVFHGYLPVKSEERNAALRRLDDVARTTGATQIFIETPYRNRVLLEAVIAVCANESVLVVAAELTLPGEEIVALPIRQWRGRDTTRYKDRPAIFLLGRHR